MKLSDTNKTWKLIDRGIYPGQKVTFIAFKGNKAIYNGQEMDSVESVEKAYTDHIHSAIQCTNFTNGSWLRNVSYGSLESIAKQKEEDLNIDMEQMNFLFSAKVICNLCLKNKKDVYTIWWDNEMGTYVVYKNEEIEANYQEMKKDWE